MSVQIYLQKLLYESAGQIGGISPVGGFSETIEEIEPGKIYKVPNSDTIIEFDEIEPDAVYGISIIINQEKNSIGTVYKIDDGQFIAKSNGDENIEQTGSSKIDASMGLLSVMGIV